MLWILRTVRYRGVPLAPRWVSSPSRDRRTTFEATGDGRSPPVSRGRRDAGGRCVVVTGGPVQYVATPARRPALVGADGQRLSAEQVRPAAPAPTRGVLMAAPEWPPQVLPRPRRTRVGCRVRRSVPVTWLRDLSERWRRRPTRSGRFWRSGSPSGGPPRRSRPKW